MEAPRGVVLKLAFGLTGGPWDMILGTRVPPADRRLLYGPPA